MNRRYLYPLLTVLAIIIIYYVNEYLDKQNESYPTTESTSEKYKEFDDSYLPESKSGQIVAHNSYTLSYSEKHEQAEWVAYELMASHLTKDEYERPYFIEDRSVKTGSADWRNYKNSGYDRGHLVPAGDRRYDYNAYHETFLTSNISPQDRAFNQGIWNRLEQKVRYWAKQYDGVYVVSGGVLKNGLESIGDEYVSVPEYFYKIVLDKNRSGLRTIAFLMPNEPSEKSIYEFVVSIDEIEVQTGIDFFPEMEDEAEVYIESMNDPKFWGKR